LNPAAHELAHVFIELGLATIGSSTSKPSATMSAAMEACCRSIPSRLAKPDLRQRPKSSARF
jgi:hypothetical protein